MGIAFIIFLALICVVYMLLNFKHDIQMLQQNSYRIKRYWKYLKNETNDWSRLIDVALYFFMASSLANFVQALAVMGFVFIFKIWYILKKKYKKPLVFTPRVRRIYVAAGTISAIILIATWLLLGLHDISAWRENGKGILAVFLLITIFSWAIVMLSVLVLTPVEKIINRKYWNEADGILRSMPDLTVIGITGSYGKTSTKHYLHRILSEEFEVLMTPGSYNTPMGVIRTVREMMKPYDSIFICEMGAKQKGDIKEICDLVHPKIGIITAVGPMHLESFKTMENVQATKFELIDALPADGFAVINNDFEYCANRVVSNVESRRYAIEGGNQDADFYACDIKYTPEGTTFTVKGPDGLALPLYTRLVGACNISNLLGAVIVALKLGMSKDKIAYAVGQIEQVEHRLSIKRTPGGVTIIDDAFNSNPSGSKMALEVLSGFSGGKRIVVTPGMIELGDKQQELNKAFGEEISRCADVAIIVGQYNRMAIESGIRKGNFPMENLHLVDSFKEAQELLATMLKKGDTVLYENDLPDTFK